MAPLVRRDFEGLEEVAERCTAFAAAREKLQNGLAIGSHEVCQGFLEEVMPAAGADGSRKNFREPQTADTHARAGR